MYIVRLAEHSVLCTLTFKAVIDTVLHESLSVATHLLKIFSQPELQYNTMQH